MIENSFLLKILEKTHTWNDTHNGLVQLIRSRIIRESQAGKLFEKFVKYYFLVEPSVKDDYSNVWLFEEAPVLVKQKLNIVGIEHGVDLVLEDTEGKLSVVQCKFRIDKESRLSWSKDKIANLFGFGNKADKFIVFSNATQIDDVSKSRQENFSFYSITNLLEITRETFWQISKSIKGEEVEIKKFTPRDYQQKAIDALVKFLSEKDRGQLILPCGTGKTHVALWIKESMRSKRTLVLVPSLALLRQTKNVWNTHKALSYKYICVCSEQDIDRQFVYDTPVVHTYELGASVSTNPQQIKNFIFSHNDEEIVIFSTYQSLDSIAKALEDSGFSFDLIISDEAHKTAGARHNNSFTLVHDNTKIPGKKRLYMTATPKIVSEIVKSRLGEDVKYLCDMGDPDTFGEEAFRMSFKKAIDKEILVDYKIIGIGVKDEEVHKYLQERRYVSPAETIDEYANNFALDQVMEKYKAYHSITFHSRVQYAKTFSERHNLLVGKTYSSFVSGIQTTSHRSMILSQFESAAKGVVSNARCLTEGIDVPAIDLVYFCDPKYSKIDIVQATGRALRKPTNGNKKLGYIVVPIFYKETENIEEAIDQNVFSNLVSVVRALSDQDERLQDEINRVVYNKGKRSISHVDIITESDSVKIITLIGFEEKLKKSLFDEIIQKTQNSWAVQYQYLLDFRKKYPNRWPGVYERFPDENKLGQWCDVQRTHYKKGGLKQWRILKLNSIGFWWSPLDEVWLKQYQKLIEFKKLNKRWPQRKRVPKQISRRNLEKLNYERKLATWCQGQRSLNLRGRLEVWKKKRLNEIKFTWELLSEEWPTQFKYLCRFRKLHTDRWPTQNEEFPKGNRLGQWCGTQRINYRKHRHLTKNRINQLNLMGFLWEARVDTWDDKYNLLIQYRRKFKNWWPTKEEEFPKGSKIGQWCAWNRQMYKKGNLPKERIEKLNSLGFIWGPFDDLWSKQFNYLVKYRIIFKNKWPTKKVEFPKGNKLGQWCEVQRTEYKNKRLRPERIKKLNSIGFIWNVKDTTWTIQFNHLLEFRKLFHNRWPKNEEEFPKGNKLGQWCMMQKYSYNLGKLSKEKVLKLNSINFSWNYRDQKWTRQYKYLISYRKKYPDRWPKYDEEYPPGNKLGKWCSKQRGNFTRGKLTKDRIIKLKKLGFLLT